jgi:hypothetical protein
MDWCDDNGVKCISAWAKQNLTKQVFARLHDICVRRAVEQLDKVRGFAATRYAAKSWSRPGRVLARVEATKKGADVRYIVTNLTKGIAQRLYEDVCCARGQAENLIKWHKSQLASGRTSCRSPLATRQPDAADLAHRRLLADARDPGCHTAIGITGQRRVSMIRLRLLKIAVRVRETGSRIKLAFVANCPNARLFRDLVNSLIPRPT